MASTSTGATVGICAGLKPRHRMAAMSATAVRLTPLEKDGIRQSIDAASVRTGVSWKRISLFGSRINPSAKGGDIDLYIEVVGPLPCDAGSFARSVRLELQNRLGERKIDLVIDDGSASLGAFGEIVKQTKVDLWTSA